MSNKRLSELQNVIKHAANYQEYKQACEEHDELSGAQEWKAQDASSDYDYIA
jgi:TAG lipase / steryl ester hydrolase / phospholipase A2 / LPA acyltransferase